MALIVLPLARRDTFDIAIWYEDRRPGLGDEFLDAYERATETITANPRLFGRYERSLPGHEVRIAPIARFRHFVKNVIESDEVTVIAVDRGRRRDDEWIERLTTLLSDPGVDE